MIIAFMRTIKHMYTDMEYGSQNEEKIREDKNIKRNKLQMI